MEIYNNCLTCIDKAVEKVGERKKEIISIGVPAILL